MVDQPSTGLSILRRSMSYRKILERLQHGVWPRSLHEETGDERIFIFRSPISPNRPDFQPFGAGDSENSMGKHTTNGTHSSSNRRFHHDLLFGKSMIGRQPMCERLEIAG